MQGECENSVLRFVVPLAMNQAIEHSVLRVMEAWLLLDAEMLRLHLGTLDRKSPNYLNLKRVRDKLVAHRTENAVHTTEHADWYRQEIGSYSKAFDVVDALAKEIASKVRALQESGALSLPNLPLREVPSFYRGDVEEILEAMRVADIF